jgi:hypothetical protein
VTNSEDPDHTVPDPEVPNPGSDEARALGCRCPVLDNNRGRYPYRGYDEATGGALWVIMADCPLHDPGAIEPGDGSGG